MAKSSHRTNSRHGWATVSLARPESLIHLTKIVSNTEPIAAHAATRMSQRTRMPNWYLVSLSFMHPFLLREDKSQLEARRSLS